VDPEKEVEFFDRFAAQHGQYDVLGDRGYRRLTDLFETLIRPRPGEVCVDLGCGTGAFTARLRRFGLRLSGMDISAVSIEQANHQANGESYVVGDITATKLPDESQDIVVYSGVLHHFPTAKDRSRVLVEGFRILSAGGRMFSYDPNAHSPSMWLYRNPRSPLFSSKGKTENEVLLSKKQLAEEVAAAGFRSFLIRGVAGISFRYVMSERARSMLTLYNAYEQLIRFSPFENRLGTFLVCAAKK
jgi:ubiquinone/menaquinone biosynthesis C-methylase UbiE